MLVAYVGGCSLDDKWRFSQAAGANVLVLVSNYSCSMDTQLPANLLSSTNFSCPASFPYANPENPVAAGKLCWTTARGCSADSCGCDQFCVKPEFAGDERLVTDFPQCQYKLATCKSGQPLYPPDGVPEVVSIQRPAGAALMSLLNASQSFLGQDGGLTRGSVVPVVLPPSTNDLDALEMLKEFKKASLPAELPSCTYCRSEYPHEKAALLSQCCGRNQEIELSRTPWCGNSSARTHYVVQTHCLGLTIQDTSAQTASACAAASCAGNFATWVFSSDAVGGGCWLGDVACRGDPNIAWNGASRLPTPPVRGSIDAPALVHDALDPQRVCRDCPPGTYQALGSEDGLWPPCVPVTRCGAQQEAFSRFSPETPLNASYPEWLTCPYDGAFCDVDCRDIPPPPVPPCASCNGSSAADDLELCAPCQVNLDTNFQLVLPAEAGVASDCQYMSCATMPFDGSAGLASCLAWCSAFRLGSCEVVNYSPTHTAFAPAGRCCPRAECYGNLKLTDRWGGWDVYEHIDNSGAFPALPTPLPYARKNCENAMPADGCIAMAEADYCKNGSVVTATFFGAGVGRCCVCGDVGANMTEATAAAYLNTLTPCSAPQLVGQWTGTHGSTFTVTVDSNLQRLMIESDRNNYSADLSKGFAGREPFYTLVASNDERSVHAAVVRNCSVMFVSSSDPPSSLLDFPSVCSGGPCAAAAIWRRAPAMYWVGNWTQLRSNGTYPPTIPISQFIRHVSDPVTMCGEACRTTDGCAFFFVYTSGRSAGSCFLKAAILPGDEISATCTSCDGSFYGMDGGPSLRPGASHIPAGCVDTAGWTDGPRDCNDYGELGPSTRCSDGAVIPGNEWAMGSVYNYPELNCCVCGGGTKPSSNRIETTPISTTLSTLGAQLTTTRYVTRVESQGNLSIWTIVGVAVAAIIVVAVSVFYGIRQIRKERLKAYVKIQNPSYTTVTSPNHTVLDRGAVGALGDATFQDALSSDEPSRDGVHIDQHTSESIYV